MSPAPIPTYDFPSIVHGDTATLAVVLKRRGVFTGEVTVQPLGAGDHVHWELGPLGHPTETRSSGDGTATLERSTGKATITFTPAQSRALPASTSFRIRIVFADGSVGTWLEGTIPARD